jgi:hypothetical protein
MRLASIAVLAVAAALAAGLQPAGAIHNDRYCTSWYGRNSPPPTSPAWAAAGSARIRAQEQTRYAQLEPICL